MFSATRIHPYTCGWTYIFVYVVHKVVKKNEKNQNDWYTWYPFTGLMIINGFFMTTLRRGGDLICQSKEKSFS